MRILLMSLLAIVITTVFLPADPSAQTATLKNEDPLFAVLLGGSEVGPNGEANVGDTNARGSATLIVDASHGLVCFGITVAGLAEPVAAHIHKAGTGINGGIVVTLTPPISGNPGASSGCVSGLNHNTLNTLKNQPSAFYVNVHTTEFPNGAIRGQLF